jgi:hypothetical protein
MNSSQTEPAGIESKIYLIRGQKVMLDFDLAHLYQVPTMRLNQQVRRNRFRFPDDFMFILDNQELMNLKSHSVISSSTWGGRRKPSLAFTEQGIAMLSSVLSSRRAAEVNIAIMRTFVQLRAVLISNHELEKRITDLESNYDGQFKLVFDAIREILSEHAVPRKRVLGLDPAEK